MTTHVRRADGSIGHIQLMLRLALALAVALLSVPFLGGSPASADEGDEAGDGTSTQDTSAQTLNEKTAEELEAERLEAERLEAERLEAERLEAERLEAERLEAERLAAEADALETEIKVSTEVEVEETPVTTQKTFSAQIESANTLVLGDCNDVQGSVDTWHQNVSKDYDPVTDSPSTEGNWENGNINAVKGDLAEGAFVWQRLHLTGLAEGPQKLVFTYDRIVSGKYAYDFVDHFYASYDQYGGPRFAVTFSTDTLPDDPTTVVGTATVTWIQEEAGDVWLFWGAHIASELDWGPGTGAGSINGSPYHQSLVSLNCETQGIGNRDNQIMASAIPAGHITIVKDAQPNSDDDFAFNISRSDNDDDFWLDDDGDNADPQTAGDEADPNPNSTTYYVTADTYTIEELSANTGGWSLTSIQCTDGTSVIDLSAATAIVELSDNEEITCTFVNQRTASLEVDKFWVINGGAPMAEGSEPGHLQLGAQLKVNGQDKPWDQPITGFLAGDDASFNEVVTIGNNLCTFDRAEVDPGADTLPRTVELSGGANEWTITNFVTCRASLTLVKELGQVGNAGNGPAQATDWTLSAARSNNDHLQGPTGDTGTSGEITAGGTYTLSEAGKAGEPTGAYVQDGPWVCTDGVTVSGSSEIQVPPGESTTCTVTNVTSRVTLVKDVTNDNGGTALPGAWDLIVGSHTLKTGDSVWLKPGRSYDLDEQNGPDGYTWVKTLCRNSGTDVSSVTPAKGEDVTCTFYNDDQAAGLTLIKIVLDPDGSLIDTDLMAQDFLLTATNVDTDEVAVSGSTPASEDDLDAGTYQLDESYEGEADDFIEGDWVCEGGSFDQELDRITLGNGQGATCVVTNTAVAPLLTLVKNVPQDDTSGANLDPDQWQLNAVGQDDDATGMGGFGPVTMAVGDYDLTETGPGAPGWTASDWSCSGTSVTTDGQGVGEIALDLGDVVVCSITNTPVKPRLTLVKEVENENTGATHTADEWTLRAENTADDAIFIEGDGGASDNLPIGDYDLSEFDGPAGYDASDWVCNDEIANGDQVSLGLGDDITCVITNTAQESTLTLVKDVDDNETGDDTPASAWTLTADGPTLVEGTTGVSETVQIGSYALSEDGPDTYMLDKWLCDAGMFDGIDDVIIGLGQHVTCTAFNVAIPGDYTVEKQADPADGATVLPGDEITYTITVTHVGDGVPVLGVTVTDDLSDVLDNATLVDGPTASDGTAQIVGNTLTWDDLDVSGTHTVTYTVEVNAGEYGEHLRNVVTDDNCIGDCSTDHFTPHYDLWKTNVPGDGETVEPGEQVTYTLHALNDSQAVVEGAVVTDDLSDVLDNATLVEPLAAGLTLEDDGVTLTWAIPTLDPGETTTVSYTVTVKADQWDEQLVNLVTPGDGGDCPEPGEEPDCSTTNPTPHYNLWKTNVPGDGETVEPGEQVTYTLHVENDSEAELAGHSVTDDLTEVLDNATLVEPLAAGLTLEDDGVTLTWAIPTLDPGETTTVSYTVTVDADQWDEQLVNLVTPGDGGDCPEPGEEPDCSTTNPTPGWELTKGSDPASGSEVMPGDSITYTLSVVNDSDGVVSGASVTDDLSDVLDNATLDEGSLGSGVSITGTTLTWTLPTLQPGDTAQTSYTVTVNPSQWDADLVNVATPAPDTGGECPEDCSTTHETPPVTTLVIQKVDFETSEALAGATFALYEDNAPFADPADPALGEEDVLLSEQVSGEDGLAKWGEILPGSYIAEETQAPDGYLLPDQPLMAIVVDDDNFIAGGEMAPIVFRDFADGLLSVLAKRQFELIGTEWVESDGIVEYGDVVKYVVSVEAIGPKLFHNVEVSDYVPGFNPDDTTSTAQATLVPDSAVCTGSLVPICDVTVGEDNLVTWALGGDDPITDIAGDVEMVVQFPELPDEPEFDENGEFRTTLWNVGYLDFDAVVGGTTEPVLQHTTLTSNEVVVEAIAVQPIDPVFPPLPPEPPNPPAPPNPPQPGVTPTSPVLPSTGASEHLLRLALLGSLALLLGLGFAQAGRRKVEPGA